MLKLILDRRHKNNKIAYYLKSYLSLVWPATGLRNKLDRLLQSQRDKHAALQSRLDYYNKISDARTISNGMNITRFRDEKKTAYFFDLFLPLRVFPADRQCKFVFGDVVDIPPEPAFVKSRPIAGDNSNAVLMKLDAARHFCFVNDSLAFQDKKSALVWRGRLHLSVKKERRLEFLERFSHLPHYDIGHVNKGDVYPDLRRPPLSIADQLNFKYILSLEGVDVATNLKWIMSSNSLCFSQRPRFETWFMEGRLIPNVHYVEIAEDFSDINDKIAFYERHPEEALRIIANANAYITQFMNADDEALLAHLVVARYFKFCSPAA